MTMTIVEYGIHCTLHTTLAKELRPVVRERHISADLTWPGRLAVTVQTWLRVVLVC